MVSKVIVGKKKTFSLQEKRLLMIPNNFFFQTSHFFSKQPFNYYASPIAINNLIAQSRQLFGKLGHDVGLQTQRAAMSKTKFHFDLQKCFSYYKSVRWDFQNIYPVFEAWNRREGEQQWQMLLCFLHVQPRPSQKRKINK